ncbi:MULTISPECIES: dienelactone hydrolase family protein [Methylorubrum]|jgi:carboxymethylenebutenolidase|uniref:Putative carboxymethylenebutenolidase n=2 Tax=Methylorubrum extorquens TaxID=408 RepID=DLHH_METEA|nr:MULTISPECIES: dienelactone hydrolase family protein [Methylorubrum]P71505.2 RecName: Full=Putative carboxymethylenebutenolidase; AltName: Full=Dienelactone hydrolase; Short=DLH; Flags: Precursor [Methylorubrum extorquens AM1]ACS39579.1 putative carboxymethylenebutenolidase precursor (dienelactone hydrolase) (tat pathway signal) [Methylorubrum extorquens AM1]EHP94095.1 Carboxymethylenebutenolidase [Methylorubrum extorquens DSM 13060]MCP1542301.1 carboxymethylenebutenolidase [Methylorubrum ext
MTAFDADLRSLAAQTTLSRRTVIATSLATGFALAVQPVAAQTTIATDANGLIAGEVKIPMQDGVIPAYRAMPAEGGPFPTILVVQEIFGVHEHIKDVCRRLAKLGYFALAPELYARQGDVSTLTNIQQIVSEVVSKVPDAQVMSDLDAAVAFAKGTGKADTARLGITGFCWGGRITWLYAAHNPAVKAGVAWYGRLVGDSSALMPKNPVDVAADLKAPVLGLYGGADQGIPVATIDRMKEACRAAGKTCDFVVYPEAGHAFHADYRPSYRAEPAQDGWKRLQDWFRQYGVA